MFKNLKDGHIDLKHIPEYAMLVANALEVAGYEAYFVGGCVRDILLGRTPKDFDIATNALPNEVEFVFKWLELIVVPTGIRHGTVTVVVAGQNVEVTTFRTEGTYSDGRHPDKVEFVTTLEQDLARRDFTVNAMAIGADGKLHDPFGGLIDLEERCIYPVGDAKERFNEDALRMLRAIRFSSQLGFNIDVDIFVAIEPNLIDNVSNERIRDELVKIVMSDNVKRGFENLYHTGLLERVLPELDVCYGFDQRNSHHYLDVFGHIMAVVEGTPKDLVTRLGALFHDIAKPRTFTVDDNGVGHFYGHHLEGYGMTKEIMKRLRFDNETTDKVATLVLEHMNRGTFSKKVMKKQIGRVGADLMENLFDLQLADITGHVKNEKHDKLAEEVAHMREVMHEVLNAKEPFSVKDLAVNGNEIMNVLDLKPSKVVGDILKYLLDKVLEDPSLNTKDQLIKEADKILNTIQRSGE